MRGKFMRLAKRAQHRLQHHAKCKHHHHAYAQDVYPMAAKLAVHPVQSSVRSSSSTNARNICVSITLRIMYIMSE